MTKANIAEHVTGWEFVDVYDNCVPPGAFVSQTREDITVNVGSKEVTVNALNWFHAIHTAYNQEVRAAGGEMTKCELCGARLRYAALFQAPDMTLHVVGQDCCERVQAGVDGREEWAIVQAMKDAKELKTKNGLRWKVDLNEPEGYNRIPYADRPTYTSTWRPKLPKFGRSGGGLGKPRVTVWANTQEELYAKVQDFRNWLKGMNLNTATKITRRPY